MEIHNITEDIVLATVNDVFDEIEREGKADRACTCFQCRLDTACFVLNRCSPHYVVSSRGVERAENETIERQQEEADIITLVHEGIEKIRKNLRPHHLHSKGQEANPQGSRGPAYNFPTIIGRIFNGANFEPVTNIEITLLKDGKRAEMIDPSWQNPYSLVANTAGTFSFWPIPEASAAPGDTRRFEFTLVAVAPGFEELRHFFEIPVTSDRETLLTFNMHRTFKLPDLYLFPPGGEEDE